MARSTQWYHGDDRSAYIHRAWMRRGRVLLGGCDKTIPSLLMAAAPVDLPGSVVSRESH
jgi:dihydroxyacid dehydratase/phosphogluconate dehydratase